MTLVLEKYGVKLKRLTEDDIEMVRQWRNDPKISKFMEYQEYITPEMQKKWFQSINNEHNYYFIIEFQGKDIGLINEKNIDYEKKEGEGGIFIYDDYYLNSDVSFRASFCQGDFYMEELGLKRGIAHIRCDNKRAIKYNQLMGYKLAPNQEGILNQLYYLNAEDYFKCRDKILKYLY
jgi:UDP-4-amino-4,6-dideoxy-N-acetyl-beta-L-altrosamine N-acetyltransferase